MIAVVEENVNDKNHALLRQNLQQLKQMRLLNGKQLNIVELPMPDEFSITKTSAATLFYANFLYCQPRGDRSYFQNLKWQGVAGYSAVFSRQEVVGIDSTNHLGRNASAAVIALASRELAV